VIAARNPIANWVRSNREILPPMAVGAALRLLLMIAAFALTGTKVMTQGDTASYLEPGRNLILHGIYTAGGLPEIDRTPGYPIFITLSGMLFGNVLLTVAMQIVVASISLFLVSKIAARAFNGPDGRQTGMAAAWLYAFEPVSICYTVRLLPETLFVMLLLVVIDRLLAFYCNRKLSTLAIAGVSLAVATYVRPVSYYLVFALAAGLALTVPRQRGLRWKAPAVLLLSTLPFLALWQVRNAIETGYNGFSSIVEQNLYFFQSAEVTAELRHISLDDEQAQLGYPDEARYIASHPEQRLWNESQRLHFVHTEAMRVLSKNRWLYFKTHWTGVGIVAFSPCATEFVQLIGAYPSNNQMPRRIINEGILTSLRRTIFLYPGLTLTKALFEVYLVGLYILAIRGVFSKQGKKLAIITLIGIGLYFLIISGGAQAVGRYRLPVEPELCVLAAGGLVSLQRNNKRGRRDFREDLARTVKS